METEIELINGIKKRDTKKLGQLMDLYGKLCYYLASRVMGPFGETEDIEECVSDVFMEVWNKINEFDPSRSSLKTWVMLITKYKALDYRRQKQKRVERETSTELTDLRPISGNVVEDLVLGKEKYNALLEAIRQLKPLDKQIFLSRYFYYEPIESICDQMKLSREAVDNRLYRARKQIKSLLECKAL